jgi:hypothetical protein
MEDNIGFRKKPRLIDPQGMVRVVDNPGGARTGGKAGGQKPKHVFPKSKPAGMKLVEGRTAQKPAPDVSDHISRQLKAVYDDVLGQPIPSRFIDLLSQLDEDSDQ